MHVEKYSFLRYFSTIKTHFIQINTCMLRYLLDEMFRSVALIYEPVERNLFRGH